MTAKKTTAKPSTSWPALGHLPRYEDVVGDLGEPNLAKAPTYAECLKIALREAGK